MNIVLENGEKINLTLNFGRLLQLKKENKPIYEKYNKVLANGAKDVIEDTIIVIYTAYLCGILEKDKVLKDNILSFEQFAEINNICQELITPKKKMDLESRS